MSFLDKVKETAGAIGKAAAGAANTAARQTRTLASEGRVKLAISSEEDKLKKAYTELGRLFYRDYAAQVEADMEEYLPWCGRVEGSKKEIQRLTEELEALKAARKEGPPASEEAAETEDTSIFADAETEETPEAAEPDTPEAADAPTGPETSAPPETAAPAGEPQEPAVNTLYVDTTGLDD